MTAIEKYYSEKVRPFEVLLELTNLCNLKCVHCFHQCDKEHHSLDFSLIVKLINSLVNMGTMVLTLSGGEILVRPDLLEIIEYASLKNLCVRLYTNATLIKEDHIRQFVKNRIDIVEISMYGHTPELHDSITRESGSFEKSLYAIQLLQRYGLRIKVKCILTSINIMYKKDIEEYWNNKDLTIIFDPYMLPALTGDDMPLKYSINQEEINSFEENSIKKKYIEYKDIDNLHICNAAMNHCAISYKGDVYPCLLMPLPCGNIKEDSFEHIWEHSGEITRLRNARLMDIEGCYRCELIEYCHRCPGVAYMENGSYMKIPTSRCRVTKGRYSDGVSWNEEVRT